MSARDNLEGALDAACPHEEGQRLIDAFAHELAETVRETDCHCWDSRDILADAIDPEVKP